MEKVSQDSDRQADESSALPEHVVYILESLAEPNCYYTGFTDLPIQARLKYHNAGKVPHTAKHGPWRIKTYVAFSDRQGALEFGRYLKSHSGRAFAMKRL